MRQMAILATLLAFLSVSAPVVAADKGHGSMPGMSGEQSMEGHGMMAMGDRVFEGRIGPWSGEFRLIDMKAQMEKSKVSETMKAKMKHTHHLMLSLTDPGTKKGVTEGKGSVTVTGPDRKKARYDLTGMQGHFGADVTLDKPGQYSFEVSVESGKQKGSTSFPYTLE